MVLLESAAESVHSQSDSLQVICCQIWSLVLELMWPMPPMGQSRENEASTGKEVRGTAAVIAAMAAL